MSRITKISLLIVILALLWASPVYAQDDPPPGLDSSLDSVLDFLRDIAQSIIRFVVFLGGVVFTVGFVWSAMRGTFGQAIGNTLQVSGSILTAVTVLMAFIFLLASVPLSQYTATTLVDRFINPESLNLYDASSLAGEGSSFAAGDASDILQSAAITEVITDLALAVVRFMIGVGVLAFIIAVVLGAFDTQLGGMVGGGMLASRGIMRATGAVGAVIFLLISFPLSQTFIEILVPRLLGNIQIAVP